MLSDKIFRTGAWSASLMFFGFLGMVWAGDHTVSPGIPDISRTILMNIWLGFMFVTWIAKMVQIWFEPFEFD